MKKLIAYTLFFTACGPSAMAQMAVSASPATKKQDDTAQVVHLSVHPAAAARPALTYLLLPDVLDREPGDSVALYFTASQLRNPRTEETDEQIRDWLQKPLKELPLDEVRPLLDKNQSALRYLALAARREHCDWDLPIRKEAYDLLLPQLSEFRTLARLVALQARVQIADGHFEEATVTLQTGFAMARHMAEGPTLINGLVGVAIAATMADQLRDLVQQPDAPNLYWALASLPSPLIDLRTGLDYEKSLIFFAAPQLRNIARERLSPEEVTKTSDKIMHVLGYVGTSGGNHGASASNRLAIALLTIKAYPAAKGFLISQGQTAAEVEAMPAQQVVLAYSLHRYLEVRDDIFKWFSLPYWQAAPGLREAERQLERAMKDPLGGMPFTGFLPSLSRTCFIRARLSRQLAALRCIELIRMSAAENNGALPSSLDAIDMAPAPIDAVTGKPFQYEVTGNTFKLVSPPPPGGDAKDGLHYVVTLAN